MGQDLPPDVDRIYRKIGSRVREARAVSGLTQAELAEQLQVTRSTIANFEAGRQRIPLHLFLMILISLGIAPSALIPDSDMLEPPGPIDANLASALSDSKDTDREFVTNALAQAGFLETK